VKTHIVLDKQSLNSAEETGDAFMSLMCVELTLIFGA
jgi:hypothetical protein